MKNQLTITEFVSQFGTERQCREHLCELKWGSGYACRKCGHQKHIKGRTWYYRKCQSCHHDESCTSGTLFHKVKFPLHKAFLMIYMITNSRKGIASTELGRQFGVKQTTAWYFKRKVQEAMARAGKDLLDGVVEVDETTIGQLEKGRRGKGYDKKQVIQVAVKKGVDKNGNEVIHNAHAMILEGHGKDQLRLGLLSMVHTNAILVTDRWKAYIPAAKGYKHIAKHSNKGQNMVKTHWHIFNLKIWIRGTHHGISKKHAQMYLDEFHYRFNRRGMTGKVALHMIKAMVKSPKTSYRRVTAD